MFLRMGYVGSAYLCFNWAEVPISYFSSVFSQKIVFYPPGKSEYQWRLIKKLILVWGEMNFWGLINWIKENLRNSIKNSENHCLLFSWNRGGWVKCQTIGGGRMLFLSFKRTRRRKLRTIEQSTWSQSQENSRADYKNYSASILKRGQ